MILGVFTALIRETNLFTSLRIGFWAGVFFVINTVYFILLEKPGLTKRLEKEYL